MNNLDGSRPMNAKQEAEGYKPFIDPADLPKTRLADGTEVKLKAGPWQKSRLGRRFNGKHND